MKYFNQHLSTFKELKTQKKQSGTDRQTNSQTDKPIIRPTKGIWNEAKWSKWLSNTHEILKSALIYLQRAQKCKNSIVGPTDNLTDRPTKVTENEAKWSKLSSNIHEILKSALIYLHKAQKRKKSKVGPTDRQTDMVTCWVACTQLKMARFGKPTVCLNEYFYSLCIF